LRDGDEEPGVSLFKVLRNAVAITIHMGECVLRASGALPRTMRNKVDASA
jgi:hypothetical protein